MLLQSLRRGGGAFNAGFRRRARIGAAADEVDEIVGDLQRRVRSGERPNLDPSLYAGVDPTNATAVATRQREVLVPYQQQLEREAVQFNVGDQVVDASQLQGTGRLAYEAGQLTDRFTGPIRSNPLVQSIGAELAIYGGLSALAGGGGAATPVVPEQVYYNDGYIY